MAVAAAGAQPAAVPPAPLRRQSGLASLLPIKDGQHCQGCGAFPGWFVCRGFGIRARGHGRRCTQRCRSRASTGPLGTEPRPPPTAAAGAAEEPPQAARPHAFFIGGGGDACDVSDEEEDFFPSSLAVVEAAGEQARCEAEELWPEPAAKAPSRRSLSPTTATSQSSISRQASESDLSLLSEHAEDPTMQRQAEDLEVAPLTEPAVAAAVRRQAIYRRATKHGVVNPAVPARLGATGFDINLGAAALQPPPVQRAAQ